MTSELVQPLATRYEFQRNSPIFLNGRGETCTHFLTGRKVLHIPDTPIYSGGKMPLHRRSEVCKHSPLGTPMTRFKQVSSNNSLNTSGYVTQPATNERTQFTSSHSSQAAHTHDAMLYVKPRDPHTHMIHPKDAAVLH